MTDQAQSTQARPRRLRYQVASSLDGFIASPDGGYDWIAEDPDIDFAALYAQFDTAVMGRKTFLAGLENGGDGTLPGIDVVVFSRTLRSADYPAVTIVDGDPVEHVRSLKAAGGAGGKDIWLYGGGELFRTLLEAGLVDTVEPAVVPVLLGGGIPLLPTPAPQTTLRLTAHRHYPRSGIMLLEYAVT